MEGFWSLLRSWLRLHRGFSQEKFPSYLGFFEFIHNVGKRGKALLHSLIELLVTLAPGIQYEPSRKPIQFLTDGVAWGLREKNPRLPDCAFFC